MRNFPRWMEIWLKDRFGNPNHNKTAYELMNPASRRNSAKMPWPTRICVMRNFPTPRKILFSAQRSIINWQPNQLIDKEGGRAKLCCDRLVWVIKKVSRRRLNPFKVHCPLASRRANQEGRENVLRHNSKSAVCNFPRRRKIDNICCEHTKDVCATINYACSIGRRRWTSTKADELREIFHAHGKSDKKDDQHWHKHPAENGPRTSRKT